MALARCHARGYTYRVIASFRHKGLRLLFEKADRSKVLPDHADKIARILARLDVADRPDDMDIPGYRLHSLKGDWAGFWSVSVSGNWRIVFRLSAGQVRDVDLIDYH